MPNYSGALRPYNAGEQRRDVRSFPKKADDGFRTAEGGIFLCIITIFVSLLSFGLPMGSLILYGPIGWFLRRYTYPRNMIHDMPLRMPIHAKLPDGSYDAVKMDVDLRKTPEKANGEGVTYLGLDRETGRQVYLTNSDDRTHMIVVGTTGSGKTEFIFALLLNQLVQNSGFIFVDAKGDINGQRQTVRLARRFGRQDDVLTISFATSGRDLMNPQTDKVTNTFNIMSSTSSAMLIELLSGMLDDSGGGGDMWQGRALAYIAAITRPLTYLRDRGYIQLSPASYIQYMELSEVEKLLFKHDGMYGPKFDDVLSPLRSYIISLPGYDRRNIEKGQESKTNEQFGFITMQLTRAINDLSYNYGHIFGSNNGGDIDIFDVVINRRVMTVLLPSMERAPATLKMLGKLIVGSIKQMMAGSLGNRMEGL
ncbi:MAG: type IV secretion system DNA-binding domain-containing protein, partial [Psychrobacter sp.]|nr:type IV secretion system DNA-binding domain-containing protein [Psychrobacter sp.]